MRDFNENYTIRDFIDKNKWSNVYMGINNEINQAVIINVLINVDGNENKIEKFIEEINLLKNIDNSNLVSINNIYKQNNKEKMTYFIESEDFEGLTLKKLNEVSKITKIQSLQIIREVLNGLLELNSIGLNFEGLSEEDIIVNSEGIVKINTLNFINKHQGYINCEEVLKSKFQKNIDVFVVGNILCELLTNKKDFNKKDYDLDLDEDLKEILEKCTNKKYKSKHKYDDLEHFLTDIIRYLENGTISSKIVTNLEEVKESRFKVKSSSKKYLAICIGLVLVSGVLVFGTKFYFNNEKQENQFTETETIINDDNKNITEQKTPTITKNNSSRVTSSTSNKYKESTNRKKNNTNSQNNDKGNISNNNKNPMSDTNNSNSNNTTNNNEKKNNQVVDSEDNSKDNGDKDSQESKENQDTNTEDSQEKNTDNNKADSSKENSTENNKADSSKESSTDNIKDNSSKENSTGNNDDSVKENSINAKENLNVDNSVKNNIQ